MRKAPTAHCVAHALAAYGLRGASFYWAVAEAVTPLPDAGPIQLLGGVTIPFDPADWISRNGYRGLYERPECKVIRALLTRGDVVVDVGANTGLLAAVCADCVGPAGRVIAIEPSPRCVPVLRDWAQATDARNVTIRAVAVGSASGRAQLRDFEHYSHSGAGTLRPGLSTYGSVDIEIRRLDDILAEEGVGHVSLLKVDVEGWEPEVLADLAPLRKGLVQYILTEVSPELGTAQWFGGMLFDLGDRYRSYAITETGTAVRRPVLKPLGPSEVAESTEQFNLLIARQDACQTLPFVRPVSHHALPTRRARIGDRK